MKGCYKAAADPVPPPAQVNLKRITADQVVLYRRIPPLGENIPISVEPFQVDYLVPTEEYIEWAVRRLRSNCSRGPSWVRE